MRPIDVRDPEIAQRLWQMQRAAYRIEADLIGFEAIPPLHESLEQLIAAPLTWLGAVEDGELVGAIAYVVESGTCDINRLFVDPRFVRRGWGRRLTESVLEHPVVTVSTGTANTPARELYRSLGFVDVATREIAPGTTVTIAERRAAPQGAADASGRPSARSSLRGRAGPRW
ncbi:Alanine acetyltransferase (plasmid) [Sandaracinus amylolyticus]|nr:MULTISPECIES: GNAT family N-acetyltransferase [Sandaracinus]UJR87237.1 Alanine acetyltransferase [Sandaracinus amylolyticus]